MAHLVHFGVYGPIGGINPGRDARFSAGQPQSVYGPWLRRMEPNPVFTGCGDAYWGVAWPQDVDPTWNLVERSPERVARSAVDHLERKLGLDTSGADCINELYICGLLPSKGLIPRGFTIPTVNVSNDPRRHGLSSYPHRREILGTNIRYLYPFDIYPGTLRP